MKVLKCVVCGKVCVKRPSWKAGKGQRLAEALREPTCA